MTLPTPPEIAVVVIVPAQAADLWPAFLRSMAAQRMAPGRLECIWVLDGAVPNLAALQAHLQATPGAVVSAGDVAHAPTLAAAICRATAPWLAIRHLAQPLPAAQLQRLLSRFGEAATVHVDVLTTIAAPGLGPAPVLPVQDLQSPPPWHACLLRRAVLDDAAQHVDDRLRPELAADVLLWRVLLLPGQRLAFAGGQDEAAASAAPASAVWRDPVTYAAAVQQGFVAPLQQAAARYGRAPGWLQAAVLKHLSGYFTVDLRERAPTVVVDEPMAVVFHDAVRQAMQYMDAARLEALQDGVASPEVRHALWSYRAIECHSVPTVDAYDHDQGLLRVTYWVHGNPPAERFLVDGQDIEPSFAKQRACIFFRRRLLRQRIAWLDVAGKREVRVHLAGRQVTLGLGPQPFLVPGQDAAGPVPAMSIDRVRDRYPPGKAALQQPLPPGWAGWKVRLLKALAAFPPVRWYYRNAWVFIDRDVDADDNAEHLYRWVRQHHPEVKAWYLLWPDSPDWPRLQAEGFRLMVPGLRRRLLALNCVHVVSSHTGKEFGLDAARFGDRMRWRYSFPQHGYIKDDLSHWLGPQNFDCFVTSSPAEHASIVADDTPYPYTDREVRRTGLPRHDRLLRIAGALPATEVNRLLVMPTWRGSLVDERAGARSPAEHLAVFAQSAYATHWRALLANPQLRERALAAGLRLTFVPHPNAEPYLAAFDLPSEVEVVRLSSGVAQQIFARTAVFLTDYTSLAFTFALLRRPVFYYQFDQKDFYSGGHNWRPGYFDYERDGFGPVVKTEAELMAALDQYFGCGRQMDPTYLRRMACAMPDLNEKACERTIEAIKSLGRPRASVG